MPSVMLGALRISGPSVAGAPFAGRVNRRFGMVEEAAQDLRSAV
ncbi:hypothetical protein [Streptomyces sp. PKU-EA00015]|nr:hypothetical protein [Streptomyces sp. PKU-EA00015]